MDPATASALISTGGNLLGGLFGGKGKSQSFMMEKAYDIQKKMWKEEMVHRRIGAEAAGYHPLAVLGMSPAQGPAVSIGGDSGGRDKGQMIADAGQGVGRAIEAHQSKEMRSLTMESQRLAVENQRLQNVRLAAETNLIAQPGTGPAYASGGQTVPGDGRHIFKPNEITMGDKLSPGDLSGIMHGMQKYFLPGLRSPVRMKSQELSESTEDDVITSTLLGLMYTVPDMMYSLFDEGNSRLHERLGLKPWWK